LGPHDGAVSRFGVEGTEFLMNPKQTQLIALSLHELATNAMKYGALSNEQDGCGYPVRSKGPAMEKAGLSSAGARKMAHL